tara:strand:- start:157 stop:354 length:198 start_codon:yes stop_codon:yes gene_type:complete
MDNIRAVKEINNIIDILYEVQKNDYLSQTDKVSINDIIGTLQYKFKEPILGIKESNIISTKGFIP